MVTSHVESKASAGPSGVAFDVPSRRRWTGAARQDDVRHSSWIKPPELPWPLRFDFVRVEEDDGSRHWELCGFEAGAPLPRDAASKRDSDEYALSASRWNIVVSNFDRYRRLAEHLLIPTPENVEKARTTRSTMARRSRAAVDDDFLALVVAEWWPRRNERGAIWAMADARNVSRTTIYRWLRQAEQRGLVPEPLPRRKRTSD